MKNISLVWIVVIDLSFGFAHSEGSIYPKSSGHGVVERPIPDYAQTSSYRIISDLIKHQSKDFESASIRISERLNELDSFLRSIDIDIVRVPGRIALPSLMLNGKCAFQGGLDAEPFLNSIAGNDEQFEIFQTYLLLTMLLPSDQAFNRFRRSSTDNKITMANVLSVQAFISAPPGAKIDGALSKDVWASLHLSANPLNRFIALEKFDSVEQSPTELLALYRECLFGACSYLEVRALEAITRNKDFREEVAKLLEEYIASNPPANDGTLPSLRNNFPNLIEGATRVIATIRNTEKPASPNSMQSDPFTQPTPAPKPPPVVQPPAPKKAPEAKTVTTSEELASTPWSVVAVSIVAATGLLWLLVKKRK